MAPRTAVPALPAYLNPDPPPGTKTAARYFVRAFRAWIDSATVGNFSGWCVVPDAVRDALEVLERALAHEQARIRARLRPRGVRGVNRLELWGLLKRYLAVELRAEGRRKAG